MVGRLILAFHLVPLLAVVLAASAAAATPSPVLIDPLDPRAGEGASAIGAPLMAALFVLGLGFAAVLATILYVRVTRTR